MMDDCCARRRHAKDLSLRLKLEECRQRRPGFRLRLGGVKTASLEAKGLLWRAGGRPHH